MPRRQRTGPEPVARLRAEFSRSVRKGAIDLLQAGNYFDESQYECAFKNVEAACRRSLADLKAIKRRMGSMPVESE